MIVKAEKRKSYLKEESIAEEVLECIWTVGEEYGKTDRELLYERFGKETTENSLREMTGEKLINIHNSGIFLTKIGKCRTRSLIRRHRLAERLLHDVLSVSEEVFERGACQFEDFVNEEIVTSICTLLGHPTVCPHGKIIPQGKCCSHTKQKLQPVLGPLSSLRTGVKAKVAYVTEGSQISLDQISSIGVNPGLKFTVHHRKPSLVIQFGKTQLALDDDVAKNIYVRVLTG